jgi:hypothetical protein
MGPGERVIVDLVRDPAAFERIFIGTAPSPWPTGR